MQSDRSVVCKHCCVVILFSVFFSLSFLLYFSMFLLFDGLRSEINVDDDDDSNSANNDVHKSCWLYLR